MNINKKINMANFKVAKRDALSDTRTNIYDLHEKRLEYFENEKSSLHDHSFGNLFFYHLFQHICINHVFSVCQVLRNETRRPVCDCDSVCAV